MTSKSISLIVAVVAVVGLTSISVVLRSQNHLKATADQEVQALLSQSQAAIHEKNYARAQRLLNQAVTQAPTDEAVHNNLGYVCQMQNDLRCAESHYKRALELNPNHWVTHQNLASLYSQTQRDSMADSEYQSAFQSAPEAVKAIVAADWSRFANRTAQYSKAQTIASEGLKQSKTAPATAALLTNLAWATWKLGDSHQARLLVTEAQQQSPTIDALCLLGRLQKIENLPVAANTLKQCRIQLKQLKPKDKPELKEWSGE